MKQKQTSRNVSNKKNVTEKITTKKTTVGKKKEQKKHSPKNKAKRRKIFSFISIIIIFSLVFILFLLSDIFNIKGIVVKNVLNIPQNEIIRLSTLQIGENMFKYSNYKMKNAIKQNPYVSDVKIKKHLNGYIEINVTERQEKYMLQCGNEYMYIDGQGYMLKLSTIKIKKPIIFGYRTAQENVKPGNRLCKEDLEQLEILNQMCTTLETKEIINLISSIDITDIKNYKISLETEKKVVNFGDNSNINDKVEWIKYFIEQEKGIEGEIFLNQKRNFFREKV